MKVKATSLGDFNSLFPDESSVVLHIARSKYGSKLQCPQCAGEMILAAKMMTCSRCSFRRSVTHATLFEHTKVPLRTWFYLILVMSNEVGTLSVNFVARHLGVTNRTAFRMLGCVRAHLHACALVKEFGGGGQMVQVDETWMATVKASPTDNKRGAIVFGIYGKNGVHAKTIKARNSATLVKEILQHVDPDSVIVTDEWRSYKPLSRLGFEHITLNHSQGVFSNKHGTSIGIEGFWANLKFRLAKMNVTPESRHLDLYLAEHTFFYNCRKQRRSGFLAAIERFPSVDLQMLAPSARPDRCRGV